MLLSLTSTLDKLLACDHNLALSYDVDFSHRMCPNDLVQCSCGHKAHYFWSYCQNARTIIPTPPGSHPTPCKSFGLYTSAGMRISSICCHEACCRAREDDLKRNYNRQLHEMVWCTLGRHPVGAPMPSASDVDKAMELAPEAMLGLYADKEKGLEKHKNCRQRRLSAS